MSYRKPDTGNLMNDYFTALMDFNIIAPHILQAKTAQGFDCWLDKMASIDRRSAVLYVKKHQEEIGTEFMKRVPIRLGRAWDKEEEGWQSS